MVWYVSESHGTLPATGMKSAGCGYNMHKHAQQDLQQPLSQKTCRYLCHKNRQHRWRPCKFQTSTHCHELIKPNSSWQIKMPECNTSHTTGASGHVVCGSSCSSTPRHLHPPNLMAWPSPCTVPPLLQRHERFVSHSFTWAMPCSQACGGVLCRVLDQSANL